MDDIVNDSILLYKEIKKSLKLKGFIQTDNIQIDDTSVSIVIGSDYHTSLIIECKKMGEVISVRINIYEEEIVIYGGKLNDYIIDEETVEHKTFTFNQKSQASKYFELLLSNV